MILVDTAVWIDHLHQVEPRLVELLESGEVCTHPMIVGELALGSIRDRENVLLLIANLPAVTLPSHNEVLTLVEAQRLHGRGLALVDAHVLAAAMLTPGVRLWTRDKRLARAAGDLGVS